MTRTNKIAERTSLTLGGRERALRFDLEAIRLIREETGVDLIKNPGALDALSDDHIVTLVWAALTHEDDELYADGEPGPARIKAIRQVRRWISFDNFEAVVVAVFQAFGFSMPEPQEGDEAPDTDPNASRPS